MARLEMILNLVMQGLEILCFGTIAVITATLSITALVAVASTIQPVYFWAIPIYVIVHILFELSPNESNQFSHLN